MVSFCVYIEPGSLIVPNPAACISELLHSDPPLGAARTGGAGHLFDSPCRGHFVPQVQVAKRAIVLVSGFYVWSSAEGTQGPETHCRLALSSLPPFQALTLRPVCL